MLQTKRRLTGIWLCSMALVCATGCAGIVLDWTPQSDQDQELITYHYMLTLTPEERKADKHIVRTIRSDARRLFDNSDIRAYAYNGVVLVLGELAGAEEQNTFRATVDRVENIKRLHDFTYIEGEQRLLHSSSDGWLTIQVQLALSQLPHALDQRTRVAAENGTVYVLGIIYPVEKHEIHRIISDLPQVRKLVLLTEIID